jgi:hypothetical protein
MANIAIPENVVTRRIENGMFIAGRVHTVAANLAANDTMDIARVPAGARITGIKIKASAATASLTIDIGDGSTVDRFLDGSTALQTADLVGSANEDLGEVLAADTTIRVTFLGAAVQAANVITAWVEATLDSLPSTNNAAA